MATYTKTVCSDAGELKLEIPRDRKSEYQPQLIPKGEQTISGIDATMDFSKRGEFGLYKVWDGLKIYQEVYIYYLFSNKMYFLDI